MLFIGIDPGKSGGLAFIGFDMYSFYNAYKMPATERDICDLVDKEVGSFAVEAVIERVSSSPQMGVASAFAFGRNYGFLRGCLIAAKIPFAEVTPRGWMKALGIRTKHKTETNVQWKNFLKGLAQQRFPDIKVTLATADALLIAEYCRKVHSHHEDLQPEANV